VEPLTPLEQQVYQYLIDFLADNTYQPSIREIGRRFQIKSTKTVSDLLHALEHKGYIERRESRSRGVKILRHSGGGAGLAVPLFREPRSGSTHTADREGFITLDRQFVPSDDAFFVRVSQGARDLGILDGDLVLVSPSVPLANRPVAVAANAAVLVQPRAPEPKSGVLGSVCGVYRPLWKHDGSPRIPAAKDAPPS
jgi:repressor LexA